MWLNIFINHSRENLHFNLPVWFKLTFKVGKLSKKLSENYRLLNVLLLQFRKCKHEFYYRNFFLLFFTPLKYVN